MISCCGLDLKRKWFRSGGGFGKQESLISALVTRIRGPRLSHLHCLRMALHHHPHPELRIWVYWFVFVFGNINYGGRMSHGRRRCCSRSETGVCKLKTRRTTGERGWRIRWFLDDRSSAKSTSPFPLTCISTSNSNMYLWFNQWRTKTLMCVGLFDRKAVTHTHINVSIANRGDEHERS